MSSTTAARPRRRWLSFSVGTMMLLVLLLGLWLGRLAREARRQREVVAAVESHGGWVHYDYEFVNGKLTAGRKPWAPGWLRRALGDEYFREVRWVSFVYDDVLALLAHQPGLRHLFMRGTQATDAGLAHLRGLTGLEDFYVWDSTLITDAGVANLEGLVNLRNIHLDKSKLTDRGFRHLAAMKKLERLVLEDHAFSDRGLATVEGMTDLTCLAVGGSDGNPSAITDAGLAVVADLEDLQTLNLKHSRVTDEGLKHLARLKKLKILDLGECEGITDDGLEHLAGLDNLQWLLLSKTNVAGRGLESLTGLKKLKLLTLPDGVPQASKDRFKSMMGGSLRVW